MAIAVFAALVIQPAAQPGALRFSVTLPAATASQPLDGRLLVMIAKDPRAGLPTVASAEVGNVTLIWNGPPWATGWSGVKATAMAAARRMPREV